MKVLSKIRQKQFVPEAIGDRLTLHGNLETKMVEEGKGEKAGLEERNEGKSWTSPWANLI